MHPEQEIVNIWLRQQGFFTVNNLNAGGNHIIDTLAVKLHAGSLEKALHVEICGSVRLSRKEREELRKRFEAKAVVRAAGEHFKRAMGHPVDYGRLLVLHGGTARLEGIEIAGLQDILLEVLEKLDRQNYGDPVTRTLQLLKYTLLEDSSKAALLFQKTSRRRLGSLVLAMAQHLPQRKRRELLGQLAKPVKVRSTKASRSQKTLGTFLRPLQGKSA